MVNLQEVLDALDLFRKLTGLRLQDIYNLMLKKGWTLGSPQLTAGMHLVIRLFHSAQVRRAARVLGAAPARHGGVAGARISTARSARACSGAPAGVPLVTILTDLADYPPHFWLEPVPQYIVCGTDRAVEQALAMGTRANASSAFPA